MIPSLADPPGGSDRPKLGFPINVSVLRKRPRGTKSGIPPDGLVGFPPQHETKSPLPFYRPLIGLSVLPPDVDRPIASLVSLARYSLLYSYLPTYKPPGSSRSCLFLVELSELPPLLHYYASGIYS